MRPRRHVGRKHQIDAARDHVRHRWRDTAIRHMDHLDAGLLCQNHAQQMAAGSDPLRRIRQAVRFRLPQRHQLLRRFGGAAAIDDQGVVERDQRRDRCEILDRIELQIGIKRRIDSVRSRVPHHQGVAVFRRVLDRECGDIACSARTVVDHDRLLDPLRNAPRYQAHHHVRASARHERHQQRDRARRIVVGLRIGRHADGDEERRDAAQRSERYRQPSVTLHRNAHSSGSPRCRACRSTR